jgi:hypothetical protein
MKKIFKTLVLVALAMTNTSLIAQEKEEKAAAAMDAHAADAGNSAWEKAMEVGEMHKMLANANGDWKAEMSFWMAPGAEVEKSTAHCMNTMILGDRFQESAFEGTVMGMPFQGKGIVGYDNIKKVFSSVWIDNMSTSISYSEGPYDAKTNSITFKGKMMDPMTSKEVPIRQVYKMTADNHHVFEMYTMHEGKEFKSMQIDYRR